MMPIAARRLLIIGAALSAGVALAHVGCIIFGAPWYRFFGAGEEMARLADAGHWYPSVVTSAITLILFTWALYALSGAGVIRRLPLLKTGLCVITAIYLLRGVAFPVIMPLFPGNSMVFWLVSSAICLSFGVVHLLGVRKAWASL